MAHTALSNKSSRCGGGQALGTDLRLRASKSPQTVATEPPGRTRNWPNSASREGSSTGSTRPATASSRRRTAGQLSGCEKLQNVDSVGNSALASVAATTDCGARPVGADAPV